LASAL
jgi:hypothetical protein